MDEREYFLLLPNGAIIRVRYAKDRGRILWFTVQLEAFLNADWCPISRYDTSHGFVHRDDIKPNGDQIKSLPMSFSDNETALNFAIDDFRLNYLLYIERYKKWIH